MVYRGRPSTGCKTCRRRKIKCDERPKGCVKCAEKGYQCPGYDQSLDRLFQDESAAVERKTQKAKAKALLARDEREKAEKQQRAIARLKDTIGVPLLIPLIDRGISFFMMHYASGVDQPAISSAAYNQHLGTFGFHPVVATAMTALGLAGVANLFSDRGLKREATSWYLDALKMTNKALIKPSEAKSDNTLLATVLLSLFEATHNEQNFSGWMEHVNGSATLLRMRGAAQFETPTGRRMYLQTVGSLTMKCMGLGVSLPKFVHEMNKEVAKWENPKDPGHRFFHLHIATIEFRAQILNHQLTDLKAIVDRALELDERAKKLFESVGNDWDYLEETCELGTPGVFGTTYHIYPNLNSAQIWNWQRYIRIYVHDIIRNSLIAGLGTTPPVFVGKKYTHTLEESIEVLYKMQSDIFASIPQYLHDTPNVAPNWKETTPAASAPPLDFTPRVLARLKPAIKPSSLPMWDTTISPSTPSSPPKSLTSNFLPQPLTTTPEFRTLATPTDKLPIMRAVSGGYSSLWALFIAGSTPIATPASQAYVLRSLSRVKSEFGINQAGVFADALRTRIELETHGISALAEREMGERWDAGWYACLGDLQRITVRSAALRGGVVGVAPVYMPRVGSHTKKDGFVDGGLEGLEVVDLGF